MIRLSPGILASSHKLLRKKMDHELFDILSQSKKNESTDGTKTQDVIDTIIACKWIEIFEETARLSARGVQIASAFDQSIKRLMICDYIRYSTDSWVSLIPRGRKECAQYLPPDVLACIKNSGLLISPVTDDVVLWWDQQTQVIRKIQDLASLKIGRVGEKLTIAHEKQRTGRDPVWKSVESNLAGYDVLSILEQGSTIRLPIEVKASERPISIAEAFITRHEWDVAVDSSFHRFHFWQIDGAKSKLAILEVNDLQKHIPIDEGDGAWLQVTIPFRAYIDRFHLPNE